MRRRHRTFRNDPDGLRLPVKLDATWRFLVRDPTSAAHMIGKLLKAVDFQVLADP